MIGRINKRICMEDTWEVSIPKEREYKSESE